MLNIPNVVTLIRIALIPVFLLSLPRMGLNETYYGLVPFLIFLAASLTDMLDGYLARRNNGAKITTLGKFLDTLADKLLVAAAIIEFAARGQMSAWIVIVILAREFVVTSLRMVGVERGVVIAAGWSGKIKMTVQIVCILFMLSSFHGLSLGPITVDQLMAWIMLAVTVWSGADYLLKYRGLFKTKA
ncbi:CDP-diacylglycerol--glycerol-3-phosphate 3-phosphatidyltransferase [Clostridia bacterium]|nr:CDP-diacylglycerol--glycerol-3-phosphate 3-phosphatidyltransferase [Clostridia bacterium]